MTRRARGKFKMKGHSIPGIKGCKTTTLEDGRAASSAFQMKSPLQEAETELEFDDPTKDMDLTGGINKSREQLSGESGYAYAMRQAALLRERRKDKEEKETKKEEDPSGVQEDQTTKYDITDLDEGQQGPHPEGDQDGDGVLDSEQGPKHDRDGDGVPDYITKPNASTRGSEMSQEDLQEWNDKRVQNLIDKAKAGTETSEGSSAIADIKKIYPEKSLEEILAMVEKGKI